MIDFINAIEAAKDEATEAVQESFNAIGKKYLYMQDHCESNTNSDTSVVQESVIDKELVDFAIRKVKASIVKA